MMKSKVVRGIINGGVLAVVAALGITVYQLGTKPLTESKDDSVQMEETGLEEEISDEGDAGSFRKWKHGWGFGEECCG